MRFFENSKIPFLEYRKVAYGLSIAVAAASVALLAINRGPVLGIDFTGGTFVQVSFNEIPPIDGVRDVLTKAGIESFTLQTQPADNSVIVRVKSGEKSKEDIANTILEPLKGAYQGNVHAHPERIEFVGPVIGRKLIADALKAVGGSMIVIILYIAFRFKKWVWGFGAVLALAHDLLIAVAFLTFLKIEITLVVIAALLTLAGYSVNDTIVVFDRVRENVRLARKEAPIDIFNRSLNETMGRTVNTSLTTLLAALSLQILGGQVIHDFSVTLTFGILIGTYSTLGLAIPFVYSMQFAKKEK